MGWSGITWVKNCGQRYKKVEQHVERPVYAENEVDLQGNKKM
jgi:hypothetical protein